MSEKNLIAQTTIAIHLTSADEGDPAHGWAHTHGLAEHGFPELEIRGLQTFLFGAAGEILNKVAQYLLDGKGIIREGETMQLGNGPFCIFAFAKLDPIPDQEHHYEVERMCLVEPPGAHHMCAVCGTGPMSHDGHDTDCGCQHEGGASAGSRAMMEFGEKLGDRVPCWALDGIAAWMYANPEMGADILMGRMITLGLLHEEPEEGQEDDPTEKMIELVESGRQEDVVDMILDGWAVAPYLEALLEAGLDRETELSDMVDLLVQKFGSPPEDLEAQSSEGDTDAD